MRIYSQYLRISTCFTSANYTKEVTIKEAATWERKSLKQFLLPNNSSSSAILMLTEVDPEMHLFDRAFQIIFKVYNSADKDILESHKNSKMRIPLL